MAQKEMQILSGTGMSTKDKSLNKVGLLTILFLTWMVGTFDKVAINVAAIPISTELGFNPQQIGLIMSTFFLSYALMNLFGGALADRFGFKRVLLTIVFLWSIFTGLTGFLWTFSAFIVVRFIFGLAEGGFPPTSSVAVAYIFPVTQRGRVKAFLVSASILGIGLGTMSVAAITGNFGWRWSFYLFTFAGVILAILLHFYLKSFSDSVDVDPGKLTSTSQIFKNMKNAFKVPMVWRLTVVYFGCGIVNWGLNSWMPIYWVKVMGLGIVKMGALQVIPPLCMFVFMQVAGFVLDKLMVGREKYLIVGGSLIVALCTYLMFQTRSVPLALTYQSLLMISMAFITATVFAIPLKYLSKTLIGSATGLINFGQQIAGAIAPALIGFMISNTGSYDMVCLFVIILILGSCSIAFTITTKEISFSK